MIISPATLISNPRVFGFCHSKLCKLSRILFFKGSTTADTTWSSYARMEYQAKPRSHEREGILPGRSNFRPATNLTCLQHPSAEPRGSALQTSFVICWSAYCIFAARPMSWSSPSALV
eukprot:scaffold1610_cov257-Pinguiococcus_pyrenoidosus.AAC.9